jgi:hypothetical protein
MEVLLLEQDTSWRYGKIFTGFEECFWLLTVVKKTDTQLEKEFTVYLMYLKSISELQHDSKVIEVNIILSCLWK